jgi:hypothetical protein
LPLAQRLAVANVDDSSLWGEIARRPSKPNIAERSWPTIMLVGVAIVLVIVGGLAALRRRSSIA